MKTELYQMDWIKRGRPCIHQAGKNLDVHCFRYKGPSSPAYFIRLYILFIFLIFTIGRKGGCCKEAPGAEGALKGTHGSVAIMYRL